MKKVLSAVVLLTVLPLVAEVTVISKIVRPRWPFESKIDVWFELSGATDPVDLTVTAQSGTTPLTLPASAVTGDIYDLGNGPHHLVIDPLKTTAATAEAIPNLSVTLTPITAKTYMIIDLDAALDNTVAARVTYSDKVIGTGTDAAGGPAWDDVYKTTKLVFRRILPGNFTMGSPTGEQYREGAAEVQREVRISKPFYLGVFEVTQAQMKIIGTKVGIMSYFTGNGDDDALRPVDNAASHTAGDCVYWTLSPLVGGKLSLRLPTAAEWEYACRAGTKGAVWTIPVGATSAEFQTAVKAVGNVNRHKSGTALVSLPKTTLSTEGGTKHVGLYPPNPWGLYDMLGNVCEYCSDYYDGDWNGDNYMVDPCIKTTENLTAGDQFAGEYCYVCRGSAWDIATAEGQNSYVCWQQARAAARLRVRKNVVYESTMHAGQKGFRLACNIP